MFWKKESDDDDWSNASLVTPEETEEQKQARLKKAEEDRIKRQEEVDRSIEPFRLDNDKLIKCKVCYDTGIVVVFDGPFVICRCKAGDNRRFKGKDIVDK